MLRVPPFRGDQVAAGVVVLTALVVLVQVRMGWGAGGKLAVALGAAAGVGLLLAGCPREARPYVSAIVTSTLVLLVFALVRLGELLGVDGPIGGAGALTWKLATLGGAAAVLARAYDAASATLVAGLSLMFVPLAFFSWATDPSASVKRLLLLLVALALGLAAVARRDRRPTHAAQLANAGGIALAAIAAGPLLFAVVGAFGQKGETAGVVSVFLDGQLGWGWEVPLLVGGFGLLAYGAVDRRRGPVLVGLLVLASWVAAASSASGGTLVGWPIVLALAAAFMLGVGLRPTTPAPPEPVEGPDAPPAPLPLPPPGPAEPPG